MPLISDEPPTPRPRHRIFGSCAADRFASSVGQRHSSSLITGSGLGKFMCAGASAQVRSRPASSSRTRWSRSSDSLAARTHPAEPAPTMMVSYILPYPHAHG